jgi:hypothetical protein
MAPITAGTTAVTLTVIARMVADHTANPLKFTELSGGTTYTFTYRYDALARLVYESRTPSLYSLAFTYDAVGTLGQ